MTVMRQGSTRASLVGPQADAQLVPESAMTSSSLDAQTASGRESLRATPPRAQSAAGAAKDASTSKARELLVHLQALDGAALREEWRRLCRSEPPRVSRDLLMRALAYRIQERAFGGLPKWAARRLSGTADGCDSGEAAPAHGGPRLKPGARLIREWHGRTHSVIVLDDGFEFEGRWCRSLTQIARDITGARWSGPRFFGLMDRRAGRGDDERRDSTRALRGNPTLDVADEVEPERAASARANPPGDGEGRRAVSTL